MIAHVGNGIEDLMTQLDQRVKALEEENRTLNEQLTQARREIADLHRGVGITLLIDGKPVFGVPGMGNTPLVDVTHAPSRPTPPYGVPAVANRATLAGVSVQPVSGGSLFPERVRAPASPASHPPMTPDPPADPEKRGTGYTDFFIR